MNSGASPRWLIAALSRLQSRVREVTGLELARVDPRLGREHALGELDRAHLHREEQTGRRLTIATFAAAPSVKLVLPMPGRAAPTTRFDGWSPSRMLSSSV